MLLLLLLLSLALSFRAEAGEIIGGHEARPHSLPYMVFLKIFDKISGETFRCGGVLIRRNVVMTAAHCQGSYIKAVLGLHNLRQMEKSQQNILVRKLYISPNYSQETLYHDIMLLRLSRKAILNKKVGLLRLPNSSNILKVGEECTTAGWGMLSSRNDTYADTLHEVQLRVQNDSLCENLFPSTYEPKSQLCVGEPDSTKATFQGDSGGPLVCNNVAQGIVSYGNENGKPPGVFTRISSFLPWIRATLRRM